MCPECGPEEGRHRSARQRFLRGVLEALAVPLAFVVLGLSGWAVAQPAGEALHPYPPVLVDTLPPGTAPHEDAADPEPAVWMIDGFNVIQVALLGGRDRSAWWTQPQRDALLVRVAAFQPRATPSPGAASGASAGGSGRADEARPTVWVVFDGARPAPEESASAGGPAVVFAPSADDWILARIHASDVPARIAVVSADRRLAASVRRRGAQVVTPAAFLARCPIRGESASV